MDSYSGQSERRHSAERIISANRNAPFQRARYLKEDSFLHAFIRAVFLPRDAICVHSTTAIQQYQKPNFCDGEVMPTGSTYCMFTKYSLGLTS